VKEDNDHGERKKETQNMKPTPVDILTAIAAAESGDWIDPSVEQNYWDCKLRSPKGRVYTGQAYTAAEAMGLAWLRVWAPDALIDGYVESGTVPLEIPGGWRFELTPPLNRGSNDGTVVNYH
jgi:hypothetical protein